jgi:Ca2+-binding EF-hand superfamily protein
MGWLVVVQEFASFLRNVFLFERLWGVFEDLDADDDRRIDVNEFRAGIAKLGCALTEEEADEEFRRIDTNGGGLVLFKEFCSYVGGAIGMELE